MIPGRVVTGHQHSFADDDLAIPKPFKCLNFTFPQADFPIDIPGQHENGVAVNWRAAAEDEIDILLSNATLTHPPRTVTRHVK
jgi:hypothetical protein